MANTIMNLLPPPRAHTPLASKIAKRAAAEYQTHMARYKLIIEYDGSGFVGWQRQKNGLSIQGALEQAAFHYCGETVVFHAAGRTDAGVHAYGQSVHVDMTRSDPAEKVAAALNALLRPAPIAVLSAEWVDDAFHARFSAKKRSYLYRILNRRAPPALAPRQVWWVSRPLDADAMHEAAQVLVGRHDFSSFRAKDCQARSPVKTLNVLDVRRSGEIIEINAQAPSFLHHQVRNMVGSLEKVGAKQWKRTDVKTILEAKNRSRAGPTAPSSGLFFLKVDY